MHSQDQILLVCRLFSKGPTIVVLERILPAQTRPLKKNTIALPCFMMSLLARVDRSQHLHRVWRLSQLTVLFLHRRSCSCVPDTSVADDGPELYRQHYNSLPGEAGRREFFSSPTLPSASARVFQLAIPTIRMGTDQALLDDTEDLHRARDEVADKMKKYLRTTASLADSVVRKCLLLGKEIYVLEQTVSIEVGAPSDAWRVTVWLDSGKDLGRSARGPWSPQRGPRPEQVYFPPVIVNASVDGAQSLSPQLGSSDATTQGRRRPDFNATGGGGNRTTIGREQWRAGQNMCHLPFQYGSFLVDKERARGDALYALSGLLLFAASAEVQFLNLLRRRIELELSLFTAEDVTRNHFVLLPNLKYIRTVLAAHAHSLEETTALLRNHHLLDWPRLRDDAVVERTAAQLLADFEHLLQQVHAMERECEQGIATVANSAALEESRRSVELAVTVQKLTVIGTVFIPLSFVCSVWGMNFKELGSGTKPMWMFAASLAPVLLFAYTIYSWSFVSRVVRKVKLKQGW